jgi:hypothetical protein
LSTSPKKRSAHRLARDKARSPFKPGARHVRTYKRKRPRQWRDKDKRMVAAVRLRTQGLSLRQIAKELAVSEGTVRNDLARWEFERPANVVPLVRKTTAQSCPGGGEITHPDYAPVASLNDRRKDHLDQPDGTPDAPTRTTGEALGLTAKEEMMARAIASLTDRRG